MMVSPQQRYAVYYALPAESALWQRAQAWLGRDCESGEVLAQPALDGWRAEEIAAATESPRRYGFHATLKAPFRLAPGVSLRGLHDALAVFAGRQRPFLAPPLQVSAIGSFIALTLSAPSPGIQALADAAVTELDSLRAPLTEDEIARRLAAGLAPRRETLLRRWGYPYVLEEFRFHMTLTGSLPAAERRQRLQTQLAELFRPLLAEPVPVREICLYSQADSQADAGRPFLLTGRFRFGVAEDSAAAGTSAEGEISA